MKHDLARLSKSSSLGLGRNLCIEFRQSQVFFRRRGTRIVRFSAGRQQISLCCPYCQTRGEQQRCGLRARQSGFLGWRGRLWQLNKDDDLLLFSFQPGHDTLQLEFGNQRTGCLLRISRSFSPLYLGPARDGHRFRFDMRRLLHNKENSHDDERGCGDGAKGRAC